MAEVEGGEGGEEVEEGEKFPEARGNRRDFPATKEEAEEEEEEENLE